MVNFNMLIYLSSKIYQLVRLWKSEDYRSFENFALIWQIYVI